MTDGLNDRERTVLHYVVHDFIETATPIGSRYISKRHEDVLGLSSATIRNIMSDLEYLGYIGHPHTSAGRVPTDQGYRFYLNSLMKPEEISTEDQRAIHENLDEKADMETLLRETSRVLGKISHQLCIVTSPELSSGTLERLELLPITGNRILVVISIKSGLIRTIMMEVASEIARDKLDELGRFLNERLSGLTIQHIRETFVERMKDAADEQTGLIRLFIDSVDKLFLPQRPEKLHIGGAEKIIEQPEFMNPREFRSIIELINNEEYIIHVLQKREEQLAGAQVTVGSENEDERMRPYSVITTNYSVGDVTGSVGVIGPTRMHYNKMIPLVDYVAQTITAMLSIRKQADG
ncbi:MAG: heat-inducible transcription repressor HrcA [Bacteroidetes bacterium]|jgi:heat-inducible transcriptional repressor|nr:heat-inducible transcription repressor HrcA [Bacteroidota bacterium]